MIVDINCTVVGINHCLWSMPFERSYDHDTATTFQHSEAAPDAHVLAHPAVPAELDERAVVEHLRDDVLCLRTINVATARSNNKVIRVLLRIQAYKYLMITNLRV